MERRIVGIDRLPAVLDGPVVVVDVLRAFTTASLVNASATARALLARRTDVVTYLITGQGGAAAEDLACADHIHALVQGDPPPDDSADRVRSSAAADDLERAIELGYRGVAADDVELACSIDAVDFAMIAEKEGGGVRVRSVSTDGPLRCQDD